MIEIPDLGPDSNRPGPTPTGGSNGEVSRARIEVPVLFCFHGEANYRLTKTIEIGVSGALLLLPKVVTVGQSLLLINPKSSNQVACRVCYVRQQENSQNHVGVEFVTAAPHFWGIPLAIKDWDSDEGEPPQASEKAAKATAKGGRGRKRLVLALAMSLGLILLWAAVPRRLPAPPAAAATPAEADVPSGLPPEVAGLIPDLAGFRIAVPADFDSDAASWLQTWNIPPSGQIQGNYVASGQSQAYILLNDKDKSWRVVVIANGVIYCDARYKAIAIAARVPVEFIPDIQWSDIPPLEPDGDGLLVVGSGKDLASGVVVTLHKGDVAMARPADYQQVSLGHIPE